jgi:hypothetical protein
VKEKGKRILSQDARRRMGEVGFRNLSSWRAQASTRARDLDVEVTAFRAGLLRDAGFGPSASKLGLIEAAALSFTCILKLRHAVIHSRKSDVAALTERASWHVSNLARIIKTMGLGAKPKLPERYCLADLKPPEAVDKGTV